MPVKAELRILLRALPLVFFACAAFAAAAQAEDGPRRFTVATGAALEALRGHPNQARTMLTSGKGDPKDPAVLVVLASMALDEGNTREAARLVVCLRAVAPGAPEGRLLDALVQERAARPQGDWISAGLAAVEKVQPLTPARPLVPVWEQITDAYLNGRPLSFPEDSAARLNPADGFLARWAWAWPARKDPVLVAEAVQMAGSDERPLVLLAALDVLASAEPSTTAGTRGEDIATARRAALAKLQGTPAGRLRFVGLPARNEAQTVDDEEIAAIAASVAEDDTPSFGPNYSELMRILDRLDPAIASGFAQRGATTFLVPPTQLLRVGDRAARSNLPDAARERLAAAFIRYAERQQREGLLLTDLIASVFVWHASELRKHPGLRARAEAVRPEVEALENAWRCFRPLLALPIRSMQRAWADQKPHERVFLQQAARRGLSCPEPKSQSKNVEEAANTEPASPGPDPAAAATR